MKNQTQFQNELDKFVRDKGQEYGLNYAVIIGELSLLIHGLEHEASDRAKEEENAKDNSIQEETPELEKQH